MHYVRCTVGLTHFHVTSFHSIILAAACDTLQFLLFLSPLRAPFSIPSIKTYIDISSISILLAIYPSGREANAMGISIFLAVVVLLLVSFPANMIAKHTGWAWEAEQSCIHAPYFLESCIYVVSIGLNLDFVGFEKKYYLAFFTKLDCDLSKHTACYTTHFKKYIY